MSSMNTILTDDEIATAIAHLYAGPKVLAMALPDELHSARAVEAAVLAKLARQEPFGYFRAEPFGWIDCAESDEDAVPLYAAPVAQQAGVAKVAACVRSPSGEYRISATSDRPMPVGAALHLHAAPVAQQAEPCRPDILERLTYHSLERDDLTLDDCLSYLAKGWYEVHGRTERQLVMQILALLAAAPEAPAQASAVDERAAFEAWYSQNAFNFERDPIGSRECGLQWKAWQARAALARKGGK